MRAHLYDDYGARLYFNNDERRAFIDTANKAEDQKTRTFCSLLHYTGCNFTEAQNFTAQQVDFSNRVIVFSGLLPHLAHIRRAIPVPDSFIELLDDVHDVRHVQSGPHATEPLWRQSKKTM